MTGIGTSLLGDEILITFVKIHQILRLGSFYFTFYTFSLNKKIIAINYVYCILGFSKKRRWGYATTVLQTSGTGTEILISIRIRSLSLYPFIIIVSLRVLAPVSSIANVF